MSRNYSTFRGESIQARLDRKESAQFAATVAKLEKKKSLNRSRAKISEIVKDISYADYLKTNWWKRRRLKAIRQARRKCNRCGRRDKLQVHHLNYKRLWMERRSDLEVLCCGCHRHEHESWIAANAHLDAIVGK